MHRALRSLMEELEAVDWYNQRVDVCHDEDLKEILAHNRDEEKEHASMVLEWIRRHDPIFDENRRGTPRPPDVNHRERGMERRVAAVHRLVGRDVAFQLRNKGEQVDDHWLRRDAAPLSKG